MPSYHVSRSIVVDAPAARVHALVEDFHQWRRWSPWEDLDPGMERVHAGEESGVGATYAWRGNRRAGSGTMAVTASTPELVRVALRFLKPFRSTSEVTFLLVPRGEATEVTWSMDGEQGGVTGLVLGRLVKMDRLMGPDFEKGLARLKAVAEGPEPPTSSEAPGRR